MTFRFGPHAVNMTQVFFETALTRAFVNIKPITAGHVLVTPKRLVSRVKELTAEEMADLFSSVQLISSVIEDKYEAEALNIAIQDGASAGQSVPHVHVHILPRRPGDFKRNDDIYDQLDNQRLDKELGKEQSSYDKNAEKIDVGDNRVARSAEVMAAEAMELRKLFRDNAPKDESSGGLGGELNH